MTRFTTLRSTACAIALLTAGTAQADVTAADVWADWQENLAMYGEDGISIGGEITDGDTLTVSNIVLTADDDVSKVTANMGDLVFTEMGDGTVSVTVADTFPIVIENTDGGVMTMTVQQSGAKLIVSGTSDALTYTASADKYGIVVDQISDWDTTVKADIRLTANDLSGVYTSAGTEMRELMYDVQAASMDVLVDVIPPETAGDYITLSGKLDGMSAQAAMTLPWSEDLKSPEDMFVEDFAIDGGYSFGQSNFIFDVKSEGEQTSGTISIANGSLKGKMDNTAMHYDSLSQGIAVSANGGGLPFPIEFGMAEYGIGIDMPLSKTEEPADFGLRVNLTGLTMNDMIWMILDPNSALPHDPLTFLVDLSGKASLFVDLLDPEQAEAMAENAVPVELNALTLNTMKLSAAGAEVNGAGAFTFDNTDTSTFEGYPRPEGDVTMNIKGANALIDKLVAMGLLPEDQAMMGRMMMGMFARTVGDDELTSKIEINKEGHVIANGQRIQ